MVSKEFVKGVRYKGNLTIYFYSKDTVYVSEKGSKVLVCVHRWFDGRNIYQKRWRPFITKLKFYNNIENIYDITRLANTYDLGVLSYNKPMPEIDKNIKVY